MRRMSVASSAGANLTGRRDGDRDARRDARRDGDRDARRDARREGSRRDGRRREDFQNPEPESEPDWLWGTLFIIALVFVLSPGVLLTLPPGRGGFWMSGNTSIAAAFVHAVLIGVVFNYI